MIFGTYFVSLDCKNDYQAKLTMAQSIEQKKRFMLSLKKFPNVFFSKKNKRGRGTKTHFKSLRYTFSVGLKQPLGEFQHNPPHFRCQ